jgi:hypothetical protein
MAEFVLKKTIRDYIKTPIASKWFILEKDSFDKSFLKLNFAWNNVLKRRNWTKDGDFTRF